MGETSIEWTDRSVNPIRARVGDRVGHHCVKVSQGCRNCYSSTLQPRFGLPRFDRRADVEVEHFLDPTKLEEVLRRRKPTKWFWCDMTDLFGEWVPFEWIAACFGVMAATPQHTHQVLTKRPGRALEFFQWVQSLPTMSGDSWRDGAPVSGYLGEYLQHATKGQVNLWQRVAGFPPREWPLSNLWMGVSAEDQPRADERVPLLRQCPAAVRFVSMEPLLGAVDLAAHLAARCGRCGEPYPRGHRVCDDECAAGAGGQFHCGGDVRDGIDWVIVGGESGQRARASNLRWHSSIIRQCADAGVPCFEKQLGARPYRCGGHDCPAACNCGGPHECYGEIDRCKVTIKHRKGGDPSEWPEGLRVRQWPEVQP